MNITDKVTIGQPAGVQSVKPIQKPEPVEKAAPQSQPRGDRVQISAQAREMQAAREAVARMPDVDAEKVARIKARLQDGTYKVDGGKVAGKMLTESLIGEASRR